MFHIWHTLIRMRRRRILRVGYRQRAVGGPQVLAPQPQINNPHQPVATLMHQRVNSMPGWFIYGYCCTEVMLVLLNIVEALFEWKHMVVYICGMFVFFSTFCIVWSTRYMYYVHRILNIMENYNFLFCL